jgi:8-oxo-dGTP pyrophosphatase MutT (NUDIX family)
METGTLESCGALIYCKDTQRHLFLLRSQSRHRNSWGIVGGKLEQNERPIDALIREVREEINYDITGLKVKPIEKFTSDSELFVYHTFMIVVDQEFAPKLNHEHKGYCWVPLDNYPKPLHPGVWRTFKFDSVVNKIKIIEQL